MLNPEIKAAMSAAYKANSEKRNDFRFSNPLSCKAGMRALLKLNSSLHDWAYEAASKAEYSTRCYGRGVFYSWPHWRSEDKSVSFLNAWTNDSWPARKWPLDTLAFCIVTEFLADYKNKIERSKALFSSGKEMLEKSIERELSVVRDLLASLEKQNLENAA